jgi:hypothetical protein
MNHIFKVGLILIQNQLESGIKRVRPRVDWSQGPTLIWYTVT